MCISGIFLKAKAEHDRADVAKYLVSSLLESKTGVSGICQKT